MGRDKAFLPWGDTTLIEHLLERLRPVTDELIVAVKDARAFRHLRATVVEDCVPDAHALGGLYTGLRAASHELGFVCGCDAPFLNPQLIRFLVGQADGYDLVIPKTARGLEALHAVYAKTALGAIERQLSHRQWDVKALVPKVRALVVEADDIHDFDPEELSLFNVNTREDVAKALLIKQDKQMRKEDFR
ncbi:MAG: molybdenum cofactor guanylyltransferase [Candidatus Omnitrophica bacterium]|nr:molybdenum cofactor guanylyltransferase [Candidatus Omnitrophota bacterium]